MPTLDDIFTKEFKAMQSQRKGMNGGFTLNDLDIPEFITDKTLNITNPLVCLQNITEEYYSKLNGEIVVAAYKPKLVKHEYDYEGKPIKNKNGTPVVTPVTVPTECLTVFSTRKIGVKNAFVPKEKFSYVDKINYKLPNDKVVEMYIYIIPKVYCYRVRKTALALSTGLINNMKPYHVTKLSLTNGYSLYLSIIPFVKESQVRKYKTICAGVYNPFDKTGDASVKLETIAHLLDYMNITSEMINYRNAQTQMTEEELKKSQTINNEVLTPEVQSYYHSLAKEIVNLKGTLPFIRDSLIAYYIKTGVAWNPMLLETPNSSKGIYNLAIEDIGGGNNSDYYEMVEDTPLSENYDYTSTPSEETSDNNSDGSNEVDYSQWL